MDGELYGGWVVDCDRGKVLYVMVGIMIDIFRDCPYYSCTSEFACGCLMMVVCAKE